MKGLDPIKTGLSPPAVGQGILPEGPSCIFQRLWRDGRKEAFFLPQCKHHHIIKRRHGGILFGLQVSLAILLSLRGLGSRDSAHLAPEDTNPESSEFPWVTDENFHYTEWIWLHVTGGIHQDTDYVTNLLDHTDSSGQLGFEFISVWCQTFGLSSIPPKGISQLPQS